MADNQINELLQWQAYNKMLEAERVANSPMPQWGSTPTPLNPELISLCERLSPAIGSRVRKLATYKAQPYLTAGLNGRPERELVGLITNDLNTLIEQAEATIQQAKEALELLKHG